MKHLNGLAVDWIGRRIYLVEKGTNHIISTDLDGGRRITVVSTDPQPLDVAVDPSARMMFWSTLERGIHAASMDGDNNVNIVSKGVEWPTGITIDYPAQRLYWADHRKGTIETVLYDGKSRHVVATFANKSEYIFATVRFFPLRCPLKLLLAASAPKKIQVFEDYIFVTTYDQQIYRLNKFSNSNMELLFGGSHRASDLTILHHLNQVTTGKQSIESLERMAENKMIFLGGNPCEKSPCSDGFVCLLSSSDASGRICKCPDGIEQVTVGNRLICLDVPAPARPCQLRCNQGACEIENGKPRCVCPVDFDGEFCDHYRCSGYCKNHGTCYVNASDYKVGSSVKPPLKCDCPKNWEGDRCDISASSCRLLCHNGAKCASNGTETCICPRGYSGKNCQNCDDLSCENDGVCQKDANGRSTCLCKREYTGSRCEKDVCEGYCSGHGQCKMMQVGSLQCHCDKGYWGKQCQSDSCAGYCENGGTCTINNANEKSCQCLPTFFGMRCEDSNVCLGEQCNADINQCDQVRCGNGGTCHVSDGNAVCSCMPRWSGQLCEVSACAIPDSRSSSRDLFCPAECRRGERKLRELLRSRGNLHDRR